MLAPQVSGGRRFGQLLIDAKRLDRDELETQLRAQFGQIFSRTIAQDVGGYRFSFGALQLSEPVLLQTDTNMLLLAATRQIRDPSRVFSGLDAQGARWVKKAGVASEGLDALEKSLLDKLTHPLSLEQLGDAFDSSDFVLARALWGLSLAGGVSRVSGVQQEAAADASRQQSLESEQIVGELALFNSKHVYLYKLLKMELGSGVDAFVRACLKRTNSLLPLLFQEVELDRVGRWQVEPLAANIVEQAAAGYGDWLRALLEAETQALMRLTGHDRGAMIVDGLRLVEQRLEAADESVEAAPGR